MHFKGEKREDIREDLIENLIKDVFKEARKDLFFPPIKLRVVEGNRIHLNFAGKYSKPEVEVGRNLSLFLSKEALKGLILLSLSRWVKHPYSLKNAVMEIFWLKDFDSAERIRNMFDDVVVALHLTKTGLNVVDAFVEIPCRDKADAIVRVFLEKETGLKFSLGVNPDVKKEIEELGVVEELSSVDFRFSSNNLSKLGQSIIKFAKIIEKYIESEEDVLEFNVSYTEKALNEIASEVGVKEFRDVADHFGSGRGKGESRRADIAWYLARSSRYTVKIVDMKGSGEFPGEIVNYSFDDEAELYSPVESLGKFIPGIAKMYKLDEFKGISSKGRNAVIVLDSSGSMKSPEKGSCAILGAFAIARKYMDSGGEVGVINFSWNTECLPPQKGYAVYEALANYQGGGTELDAEEVVEYVKRYAKGYDIVLITDAGIENVDEVVSMLEKLKGMSCKTYFIWIQNETKGFMEKKDKLEKFAKLIVVKDEEDIPGIVIGM